MQDHIWCPGAFPVNEVPPPPWPREQAGLRGTCEGGMPTSLCYPDMPHPTPHPSRGSEPPRPNLGSWLPCPQALQF